jgi:FkbM family methyltransferase
MPPPDAAAGSTAGGPTARSENASRRRCFGPIPATGCAALLLLASTSGCRRKTPGLCPEGNRVSPRALAPRLLHDDEEIDAYLKAFPRPFYRITEVKGVGQFYIDENPALVKRYLALGLPWEPHVLVQFSKHVRRGSTALDVGAHIGSHTVPLAHLVGGKGMVYAFEPVKKVYRELVQNLELNKIGNAKALRYAIGARNEVIEMNPVAVFDGRTSVGKGGDRAELRTLDGFGFCNVSLIKIDVEGYEAEVLRGAEETIRRWRPAIILEILHANEYDQLPPAEKARVDETRQLLRRYGYRYQAILENMHDYLALPAGR